MNDFLAEADVILQVENLAIAFPHEEQNTLKPVVKGLNFILRRGEILGIVGESGSGKSITALGIMGLIPAVGQITNGTINCHFTREELQRLEIDKKYREMSQFVDLLTLRERQKIRYRGGKIAMIFQEPMSAFNPVYTIGFQLIEAVKLHQNVTLEQAKVQAINCLREVTLFPSLEKLEIEYQQEYTSPIKPKISFKTYQKEQEDKLLNKFPHELSGGQLQRVMIAMAISCDPSILIADEPTTALDVTTQNEILDLLKKLCKTHRDMAMIFISHDLGVINQIADSVLVMYQGEEREFKQMNSDNHQGIFATPPQDPYTKGLLACRPRLKIKLDKLPIVSDFMEVTRDEKNNIVNITSKANDLQQYKVISLPEEMSRIHRLVASQNSQIILKVAQLSVIYQKSGFLKQKTLKKAVNNISFDVYQGETLGLVGESGCGKSTLARAILRLIPSEGLINFYDQEVGNYIHLSQLSLRDKRLRDLRRKIQIIFQNPYNSLNPRITIGATLIEPMIIHRKFIKNRETEAKDLLNKVGLDASFFNRYPHELSGGQRQRVCIARALALRPSLIICDESVSALDVSIQAEVLNLLKQLQKEENLTYIFISHDLSVVRFMSDRILVMKDGKAVENPEVKPAYKIINERNQNSAYTNKLIDSIPAFPEEWG